MSDSRVIVEKEIGGHVLSIESGWVAKQANGAVIVRYGENAVFNAVVSGPSKFGDGSFLPLTVDYRERYSAVGKFPGGFFKREARPTNKETLTMRLTDRPIRPMWPDWFRDEVLIQGVVYSSDRHIDTDTFNVIGASAALVVSDLPFQGPIGAVRVSQVDGEFVIFPTHEEREAGDLDLVVAGSKDALLMVECGAKMISEARMVEALEYAHNVIREICTLQVELAAKKGVKAKSFDNPKEVKAEDHSKALKKFEKEFVEALNTREKHTRKAAVKVVKEKALLAIVGEFDAEKADIHEREANAKKTASVKDALHKMEKALIRQQIIKDKKRVDGRGLHDVRPIQIETNLFPRTHGSALFTRGETQALVTCTLGTRDDEQMVEGLKEKYFEKFMLHYNFPPYSVGEVKRIMGPGRREIGHGMLAQRALTPLIPSQEEFPYTIRLISDIMESNGSSSMASVCGGSLAAFHAGVPMKEHVAGIAMGLVMEGKEYAVLTDILGDEDHVGDMDFKVCGTATGITALQMDIKCDGLTSAIMGEALEAARKGRLHILAIMNEAISTPGAMSQYAPRVAMVKIDPSKIGMVIGAGGKMIRSIEETTGCKINIEEDGTIKVYGYGDEGVESARSFIERLTEEAEVGKIYKGRVTGVKDFGAFVEILPGQEGMCHISELDEGYVEKVSDIVKMGDEVEVKVILVEDNGRIKLSRKAVQMEQAGRGEEYAANLPGGGGGRDRDRGDRGDRGGRGGRDRGGRGGDRGGRDRDRGDRGGSRESGRGERTRSDRGDRDRDRDKDKDKDRDKDRDRPRSRRDADGDGDDRDRDRDRDRGDRDRGDRGDDRPRRSSSRSDSDRESDERPARSRSRSGSSDSDRGGDDDERPARSRSRSGSSDSDRGGDDDDRPARSRSSRGDTEADDVEAWSDPYLDSSDRGDRDRGAESSDDAGEVGEDGAPRKKRRRRRRRRTITGETVPGSEGDADGDDPPARSGAKDDYPDTADMFDE
ncbi:MAG: polyribonucleotide nucleotidyltransferase [Planctomycetota bacterium]